MAARAYYGQSALHGKSAPEMQEMLFAKGVNFNDFPSHFKRGSFVRRRTVLRGLTEEELARIPEAHRPSGPVERSEIVALDMPPFGRVTNRVDVVCDSAAPEFAAAERELDAAKRLSDVRWAAARLQRAKAALKALNEKERPRPEGKSR